MSDNPRKDQSRQPDSPGRPERDFRGDSLPDDSFAANGFSPNVAKDAEQWRGFDRSVRRQLLAVRLPEGFQERLVAAVLRQAKADPASEGMMVASDGAGPGSPIVGAESAAIEMGRGDWSRRRWLRWTAGVVAGGTAAAVVVSLTRRQPATRPMEAGEIMEAAGAQFELQEHAFGTGIPLASRPPADPYRFSRDVLGRDIRWRSVVLLQRSVVAFDMRSSAGDSATLFALVENVAGLPRTVPSRPLLRTSRTAVAAWNDAPLTYVLVVQGDSAAYRRFLAPLGPVA
ncbi:hypothetical protein [Thermopirellula anaerolimosa]